MLTLIIIEIGLKFLLRFENNNLFKDHFSI